MDLMDLGRLEYPRHVHGPGWAYRIVKDAQEAAQALDEGWSLLPVLSVAVEPVNEPETVTEAAPEAADAPVVLPKRRGRPPKVRG